jgi:hypothetical protein
VGAFVWHGRAHPVLSDAVAAAEPPLPPIATAIATEPAPTPEQAAAPRAAEATVAEQAAVTPPAQQAPPSSLAGLQAAPPQRRTATQAEPSTTVEPATAAAPETEPAAESGDPPLDREALQSALNDAIVRSQACRSSADPFGSARATVTFAPSGRVTQATISGEPFAGTAIGGCLATTLRSITIPRFSGQPVTIRKTIGLY